MIHVLDLGRCDYSTALRLQETLVTLRKQQLIENVLLFVEHPPVITLGRNARPSNIVVSRELLSERGIELHEINRGGDVTVHAPGQLVAYPIFDLRSFEPKLGVIDYVRRLEDVLMRICAHYSLETQRIAGLTGVWTYASAPPRLAPRTVGRDYVPVADEPSSAAHSEYTERKLAAIGVHISRGVTSHGFALNVTTDLDYFKLIVPCGLTKPVTSIEFETGLRPAIAEVMSIASRSFGELFRCQVLWLESIHDLIPTGLQKTETPAPEPEDTPLRAPEPERRIAGDDTHFA